MYNKHEETVISIIKKIREMNIRKSAKVSLSLKMIQDRIEHLKLKRVANAAGELEEIEIDSKKDRYSVIVCFHAAFNDISTAELFAFSESAAAFQDEKADIICVCRESTFAIREWMAVTLEPNKNNSRYFFPI